VHRVILPLLLVAVACQPASPRATTTGPDVDAIATAFEQAVAAVNAGDVEGMMAFYADDEVMMSPSEPPVSGKAAIRSMMEGQLAQNTVQLAVDPVETVVAGDLGVMRTHWAETATPRGEGEPAEYRGDWLIVWRKQADGTWRFWRDMYSMLPPAAPAAEPM
jgi:uncharacterized protein (TIGR02246 family)